MMGSLGIGSNLNHWQEADNKLATEMIALYKQIRGTVQMGDLYRLLSPRDNNMSASQYVSTDGKQSVVFAYLHSEQYMNPMPPVYLRGLDENALYKVRKTDNRLADNIDVVSGAYLMHHGITLRLHGDYDATAIILDRQ